MKEIILFALAICIFHVSSAQISKGNWLLGGNLAYMHVKPKENAVGINSSSEVDAAVNAGYFIVNKLVAGVRLNTNYSKFKFFNSDSSTHSLVQQSVGFGPLLRYYVLSPEKKVNVFGDAGFLYSLDFNKARRPYGNSWTSSLGAGAIVFLNQMLGVEGLLSFNRHVYVGSNSHVNSLQFKVGLQAYL